VQGVQKIDKTDVAAAILRMDVRRKWFDMKPHQKAATLHNPPAILATAILELPPAIHGLDEAKEDELRESAFSHDFPDHANDIAELKNVLEFTTTAISLARDQVRVMPKSW